MIPLSTRREDDLLASIVTMRLLAERIMLCVAGATLANEDKID